MGEIKFGTGGVRGVMGDGEGLINSHVIQHITFGLAKVILTSDAPKSVGVAYDTRFNSEEFAETVCKAFSAFGIKVHRFNKPMPTPVLSHAIRLMSLGWGVCITASHNPQEYNGYKVYDRHGVQVTDLMAAKIMESIDSVDMSKSVPGEQDELIHSFSTKTIEAYFKQIVDFVGTEKTPSEFPFVYSALHGAGTNAVPVIFDKLGFSPVCVQQNPDGAFGGLKTPNPEEPVVYDKALKEAEKIGAKLLLATDPDCDRVGVMVKTGQGFELINGNQVGALLIDFLAQTRGVKQGDTVISTIVSGGLGEKIANDYGLEFKRLLTGFKYIGECIVDMPDEKKFFFGYEESYGYLAGDGARDKDAVIASALIVKMAAYYDKKGKTLIDRLTELSEKHGYFLESLNSVDISQKKQKEIMTRLRNEISIDGLAEIKDYSNGIEGLPPADVLKLYFTDNSNTLYNEIWAAFRPSGTEPKLKLYTGVHADTQETAKAALIAITDKMISKLK